MTHLAVASRRRRSGPACSQQQRADAWRSNKLDRKSPSKLPRDQATRPVRGTTILAVAAAGDRSRPEVCWIATTWRPSTSRHETRPQTKRTSQWRNRPHGRANPAQPAAQSRTPLPAPRRTQSRTPSQHWRWGFRYSACKLPSADIVADRSLAVQRLLASPAGGTTPEAQPHLPAGESDSRFAAAGRHLPPRTADRRRALSSACPALRGVDIILEPMGICRKRLLLLRHSLRTVSHRRRVPSFKRHPTRPWRGNAKLRRQLPAATAMEAQDTRRSAERRAQRRDRRTHHASPKPGRMPTNIARIPGGWRSELSAIAFRHSPAEAGQPIRRGRVGEGNKLSAWARWARSAARLAQIGYDYRD